MDLTPTNSDDEVQELREILQSMPSPSKPPEAKRGRIARYIRLEILILAVCLKLSLGNHNAIYTSTFLFSLFSFLTKCFLFRRPVVILSDDESDDACVNRRRSPDNDTCRPKPTPTQPSSRSSSPLSYGSSIPSPAPSL